MFYSDDPVRDYDRYCAKQDRELAKLPVCCECDDPIQEEFCYEFDGEYICTSCLIKNHRKQVDDCVQ